MGKVAKAKWVKITRGKTDECIVYVITRVTSGMTRLEGEKAVGWERKVFMSMGW